MKSKLIRPITTIACLTLLSTGAFAATIVDPTLVTGSAAIDPDGSETIDQRPGVLPEADLEARAGFRGAIQSLGVGFEAYGSGTTHPTNVIAFTDPSLPDIRFTVGGTNPNAQTGVNISNTGNAERVTSGTAGFQFLLGGNSLSTGTVTLLIEFGTLEASVFTANGMVDAAGFTVGNARDGQTYVVQFRDTLGGLLSEQTLLGAADSTGTGNNNGIEGYFGFGSDGLPATAIGSILITRTNGGNIGATIDDLAFAVIPEPSSALLLMGGLASLCGRPLRRNRV